MKESPFFHNPPSDSMPDSIQEDDIRALPEPLIIASPTL